MYANRIYVRFTLSYDAPASGRITLRNLAKVAADEIIAAQTALGATSFEVIQQ